ncbi:MAG: methyl-accepting chemotaxis protein [Salinirussus sp.]
MSQSGSDGSGSSLLPDAIRGSYATRLGAALAFSVLAMVAFGLVISSQASAAVQDDVETRLTTTADSQADRLDAWIESTRRNVRSASAHPALSTGSDQRIQGYLSALVEQDRVSTGTVAVHYLNTTTGTIELSSNEQFVGIRPAEVGASFAGQLSFDGPGDTHVSKPFTVPVVDHPIIAVISPVEGDDDHVLVYMTDLGEQARQVSERQGDSFTTVLTTDGQIVAHPNQSRILTQTSMAVGSLAETSTTESRLIESDSGTFRAVTRLENKDWIVAVNIDRGEAFGLARQINADLIGLLLFALINLGIVGVTVGSSTTVALKRISERARQMGEGDLTVDLSTARTDEFGTLYSSFDRMRASLREKIEETERAREEAEQAKQEAEQAREEAVAESETMQRMNETLEHKAAEYREVLNDVADGDLTCRVDPETDNEAMASVGREINSTLAALEAIIADTKTFAAQVDRASDEVGTNAERVDEASQQVRTSTREIFDGTSEQSERLSEAANDMEELSAAAEEVAASAQQVASTSQSAAEVGERGREAAQAAIEEMNAIDARTDETVTEIRALADDLDEIGDIVDVITEIVEQTNMLALNASIEAARADAGGDGFAVVADEIKSLAEETKEAAGDIEDRIERIQTQADDTVDTMESTSERITDSVDTVQEAIDALEDIAGYTEEVDVGIQEIDDATEEQARTAQRVMEMIDELSSISEETAAQADTVAGAAEDQTESIEQVADSARDLAERANDLDDLLSQFVVDGDATAVGPATASAGGDD